MAAATDSASNLRSVLESLSLEMAMVDTEVEYGTTPRSTYCPDVAEVEFLIGWGVRLDTALLQCYPSCGLNVRISRYYWSSAEKKRRDEAPSNSRMFLIGS